jgi:hypothetical protein
MIVFLIRGSACDADIDCSFHDFGTHSVGSGSDFGGASGDAGDGD